MLCTILSLIIAEVINEYANDMYDLSFTDDVLTEMREKMRYLPVYEFREGSRMSDCLKAFREIGAGDDYEVGYSYEPLLNNDRVCCIGEGGVDEFVSYGDYSVYYIHRTYITAGSEIFVTGEFEFCFDGNSDPEFTYRKKEDVCPVLNKYIDGGYVLCN